MKLSQDLLFPSSLKQAALIQKQLSEKITLEDQFKDFKKELITIAGMDVSNNPYDPKKMVYAGIAILDIKNLKPLETAQANMQQPFPYVPGFLGFREAPVLIQAYQKLSVRPSLIMVDGHGISHPRGLGIASHIGVLLDCPTIGVAKSILVGTPQVELSEEPGSEVPLIYKDKQIATLLRSKARSKPLIISPGYKVSLTTAVEIVRFCLAKYRLPEPTRYAHLVANDCRKKILDHSQ